MRYRRATKLLKPENCKALTYGYPLNAMLSIRPPRGLSPLEHRPLPLYSRRPSSSTKNGTVWAFGRGEQRYALTASLPSTLF